GVEPHVVKEALDLLLARPAEITRRDDLVGVDVGLVDRYGDSGEFDERFHGKLLTQHLAHVGETAGYGGGRRHRRTDEVRAHAAALAADEVAVRGRGDALARRAGVAVDADAHRAPRLAPVEARVAEDLVEALRLGLLLDEPGTRDHPGRHLRL